MSLNHIIRETVINDERLNVKFDICEVNQLIIDGSNNDYYGSINTSTVGEAYTSDLVLTNPTVNMCNRIGDAFNVGYSGSATMTSPAALATFSIIAPYPTKIRTLVAATPAIINTNNLFSEGYAHISTVTLDEKGHHFYVNSSEPAPGQELTHIKINFVANGLSPATTGGFALTWRVSHNSAGNPPV